MRNAWLETVAEAQRRAKKRLPPSVYGSLVAGSEIGLTVADNIGASNELGFAPTVAGKPAKRDLTDTRRPDTWTNVCTGNATGLHTDLPS